MNRVNSEKIFTDYGKEFDLEVRLFGHYPLILGGGYWGVIFGPRVQLFTYTGRYLSDRYCKHNHYPFS